MKKSFTFCFVLILGLMNSQVHRFYYEMTYYSHKDSIQPEKEIMVLDVAKDESLFLSYKQLEFDSTYIAGVKKGRQAGKEFISPPSSNFKKWSFRVNKLKKGKLIFNDFFMIILSSGTQNRLQPYFSTGNSRTIGICLVIWGIANGSDQHRL